MLKLSNLFNFSVISCNAPKPWGVNFQDSASLQMEDLVELHDKIMFYLVIILFGVAWVLISIVRNYVSSKQPISNEYLNHGTLIELIWTITPILILMLIVFPLFKLLYLMDEATDSPLISFVEKDQWYLSYQYPDFISNDGEELLFGSYLVPEQPYKFSVNLLSNSEGLPGNSDLGSDLPPLVDDTGSVGTESDQSEVGSDSSSSMDSIDYERARQNERDSQAYLREILDRITSRYSEDSAESNIPLTEEDLDFARRTARSLMDTPNQNGTINIEFIRLVASILDSVGGDVSPSEVTNSSSESHSESDSDH